MDQFNQTPPQFNPRKTFNKTWIVGGVCIVLCSGVFAFGGTYLANTLTGQSSGVVINQTTGHSASGQINDVSEVASKCGPSVVEIITESVSSGNNIFGQYIQEGAGSGVIMSEDGYIITNNHVIDGATSILVRTTDGNEYNATLTGADSQTDLAVIKIDAHDLKPASFGDSDALQVGDAAIAIGNPLGELGGSVSCGIISALDRQIEIEGEMMTLLQTDAAINPGNSGGGLFDADGNLIGIVNAKTSSTGIEGLGFAIPINGAIEIINELIDNGSVTSRPFLGVSLYDYSSSSQGFYSNQSLEDGCYIVQIVEGGSADLAGLEQNDRIVSFDGQDVSTSAQVKAILREHKIGDKVKIVVQRGQDEVKATLTLQGQNNS